MTYVSLVFQDEAWLFGILAL